MVAEVVWNWVGLTLFVVVWVALDGKGHLLDAVLEGGGLYFDRSR